MKLIEKLLDYMYSDREYNALVTTGLIGFAVVVVLMTSFTIWKKLDHDFELANNTAIQAFKSANAEKLK